MLRGYRGNNPRPNRVLTAFAVFLLLLLTASVTAKAQSCSTTADMDASTRTSLESAARQYYQAAQQGGAALQPYAEFDVAGIVDADKDIFTGQATPRAGGIYLLDNSQPSGQRAEFFCGIFNSPERTAFLFEDLPAGRYGIVIDNVAGKTPGTVSWVLHQSGAHWKLAGLFVKSAQLAGHDANWYITQARAYKAKGQTQNAWFYYLMAFDLSRPLGAMSTPQIERLYDETQQVMPRDLPANGRPADLAGAGRSYRLISVEPMAVGDNLDLVVRYQQPDISDTGKAFQDNMAVMKALVTRYPELRDAFAGVIARAVAPDGQDYGSLLAMKDVK